MLTAIRMLNTDVRLVGFHPPVELHRFSVFTFNSFILIVLTLKVFRIEKLEKMGRMLGCSVIYKDKKMSNDFCPKSVKPVQHLWPRLLVKRRFIDGSIFT
jgi:hypothetical protein